MKIDNETIRIAKLYNVKLFVCKKCHFMLINKEKCYCESIDNKK